MRAHILKPQTEGNRPQCDSWYAFETLKPTPMCTLIFPKTVPPTQDKYSNIWTYGRPISFKMLHSWHHFTAIEKKN